MVKVVSVCHNLTDHRLTSGLGQSGLHLGRLSNNQYKFSNTDHWFKTNLPQKHKQQILTLLLLPVAFSKLVLTMKQILTLLHLTVTSKVMLTM